jgi:hypothetical protein
LGIAEALNKSFDDLILGDLKDIRDNIGHTLLQNMEELILTDDPLSQSRVEKVAATDEANCPNDTDT